jgi:fucose 4-O-acetylase-like acetyltransferase
MPNPSRPADSPNTPSPRIAWIDVAKGWAILLVVFGHAWRNAGTDGLIDPAAFKTVDRAIYLFHMPAFFVLSGMLLPQALARTEIAAFVKSRPVAILLPLLFWAYVQALLRVATKGWPGLAGFLVTPLRADTIFWFLWVLLACQLTIAALSRFKAQALLVWIAVALCLTAIWSLPRDYGSLAYRFAEMFPFYAAGTRASAANWQQGRFGAIAGTAMFIVAQIAASTVASMAAALYLCAVAATGGFLLLCAGITAQQPTRLAALTFLGRQSMTIYLLHVPFLAVHIFLTRWGLTNPALQLAVSTALGVVGPIATGAILIQVGLSMLLGQHARPRPGVQRTEDEQPSTTTCSMLKVP